LRTVTTAIAAPTNSAVIAQGFGPRGITVNAVSPGVSETDAYRTGKS
jgi:NAD(P)-dependent dehydrogenase (short-subunit alcohol dehydrogenase family)